MDSEKGGLLEECSVTSLLYGLYVETEKKRIELSQKPKKRIIVLSGPTASGKTDLSLVLAKMVGGEIVCSDSVQVYRGLDIGSAKVSLEERLDVPHHLVDIKGIDEEFNVVDFYYDARLRCQEILERGNIPIVVGGSGFYVHAFIYGPPEGPPSVPEVREKFEKELKRLGPEALYERLQEIDPDYANTITPNDRQKVVRAFEIMTLTKRKVSEMEWKGRKQTIDYDFRCWFIHRPRDVLYQRIERRCEKMIEEGLLDEVERMIKEGLRENRSASQAIGYKQALEFLDSNRTEKDYQWFLEKFKQASRRYAKRQFTWFRKEPLFRWLDIELHDPETAVDIILKDYGCLL